MSFIFSMNMILYVLIHRLISLFQGANFIADTNVREPDTSLENCRQVYNQLFQQP